MLIPYKVLGSKEPRSLNKGVVLIDGQKSGQLPVVWVDYERRQAVQSFLSIRIRYVLGATRPREGKDPGGKGVVKCLAGHSARQTFVTMHKVKRRTGDDWRIRSERFHKLLYQSNFRQNRSKDNTRCWQSGRHRCSLSEIRCLVRNADDEIKKTF